MRKNHYVKALFSSREGYFSLRWIRGILAIRRRACVSLRRGISGRGFGDEERGRRGVMMLGRLRDGDCVPLGEETTYIYI